MRNYIRKKERQVCTYEQAVKFKQLGLEQRTLLCYTHPKESYIPNWKYEPAYSIKVISGEVYDGWSGYEYFSAYTLIELGDMIGKGTQMAERYYRHLQDRMNQSHSITICFDPIDLASFIISDIENGHSTVEELNQRLLAP